MEWELRSTPATVLARIAITTKDAEAQRGTCCARSAAIPWRRGGGPGDRHPLSGCRSVWKHDPAGPMTSAKYRQRLVQPGLLLQVYCQGIESGWPGGPVCLKVVQCESRDSATQLLRRAPLELTEAGNGRPRDNRPTGPLHPDALPNVKTTPRNRMPSDAGLREDANLRFLERARDVVRQADANVLANECSSD